LTTPYDPYASATNALPVATQNQIPGNVVGINSATINTSEMNITSNQGAVFGYSGQPGVGNLYVALAASGGTDQFGNTYSTGLNAQSGLLAGVSVVGATLDETSTLQGSQVNQASVLSPSISGGTSVTMTHMMTNTGGPVLGYTVGNTTKTYSTQGTYSWTCPSGVTAVQVQCWGAGAGGGGGNSNQGGESGGGGEYAAEPSLPVTPGSVYTITVGAGGNGGVTNQAGSNGGQTTFANQNGQGQGVVANGGTAGYKGVGGFGGNGSTNTIHFDGGNGASESGNEGGQGGGSSASGAGEGNQGNQSTGSSGGSGGTGIVGGGAGGAGGNYTDDGLDGTSPGGAGGGAGADGTNGQTATYTPSAGSTYNGTYSYYGTNANNYTGNSLRNHNGPLYQGTPDINVFAEGYQYSIITLPYGNIQSQMSGKVISSVSLGMTNLHSYYSSGVDVEVQYVPDETFGNSYPVPASGQTFVGIYNQGQGTTLEQNLNLAGGIGVALQNGNCSALLIGSGDYSPWQDYYGYFQGEGNGSGGVSQYEPYIQIFYNDGGIAEAGDGADGQCSISYNPTTPEYTLSVSSQADSDPYGNPYPVGFTGPQLTLTGQASTPATVGSSAVAYATASGVFTVLGPMTVDGYLTAAGGLTVGTFPAVFNDGITVNNAVAQFNAGINAGSPGSTISSGLTVGGGLNVASGGLTVSSGETNVQGFYTHGGLPGGGATAGSSLTVGNGLTVASGLSNFSNGITVGGNPSTIGQGVTIGAGLTVATGGAVIGAGPFGVTAGLTTLGNGLQVTGGATLGASLTVGNGMLVSTGVATFNAGINAVGGTVSGGLAVGGGLNVASGGASIADGLSVSGPLGNTIGSFLVCGNGINISSGGFTCGTATLNQTVIGNGVDIVSGGCTVANTFYAGGTATLGGGVVIGNGVDVVSGGCTVANGLVVGGVIVASGGINCGNGITVANGFTSSSGVVNLGGLYAPPPSPTGFNASCYTAVVDIITMLTDLGAYT
jgi:hypothetical protein